MKQKNNKLRTQILFGLLLVCSSFSLMAQTSIEGVVLSVADQMPLAGASVLEKGTVNGASTDFDGNFTLTVSDPNSVLVISYLGYKTKEVVASTTKMTILLAEDAGALDEVVVVGYGTQKRSDIVNAVASTDMEKAILTPTSDVNEQLRGRIAGLQVDVGGGTLRPGGTSDIIFRGLSSIEGNVGAIYVVDGIIREGGIEDLDSDDIESIEFLKDASAQAIYGSRGANGVVLITTKRGSADEITISYHGFLTTKSIERNFDVYSGQELAQLRREAVRANTDGDVYPNDEDIFSELELESLSRNEFVDWEDALVTNGMVNSQNISLSGGTESTKIFGSINYFNEEGIIPTSSYNRNSFRLNLDQKINNKISVNFDLNVLNDFTERAANVNVITFSPLGRAFDDEGNLTQFPSGEELSPVNPIWNLREQNNEEKGNDYVVNITPIWQINDDFQYQLKTNFTRRTSERGQYQSSLSSAGDDVNGIARIENRLSESFLVENILTYDKLFGEAHKVNLLLLQSAQKDEFSRTFTQGEGFTSESLGFNGITEAIGNVFVERSDGNPVQRLGLMARARYSYMDKYLFEATIRRDGSSRNGEDNRYSNNAGGSFAWNAHKETFLENVKAIRQLKLRIAYGSLINDLSLSRRSLFLAEGQRYIFDGESASGFAPSTALPNPDLEFETITTLNFGLDFLIFDNLLSGSINYYDKRTTNLLLRRPVPSITGYEFTYFNAGELQNEGIELNLTANIINTEDFRWSVTGIWSNNTNKILELYNDGEGNPVTADDAFNYYEGQPIGVIYQYQFDGIWQEGDDFENAPQANPESINPQENLRPGDIRISDVNGDGIITQDDRVFTDPNPDWFGSLSTTFAYRNFDLFLDFYAVEGATKVNPFLSSFNNGATLTGRLNGVKVNYYTPENPSNSFPRPSFDVTPQYLNALAVRDASYVRLRTVSLGYSLGKKALAQIGLDQLRFYVTGNNLFTNTDYIGYSPEVNIRDTFSNADTGYPDATSYTFGVRVKF